MAKTFKLELLAADRPFFVGECEHLDLSGTGWFGWCPAGT